MPFKFRSNDPDRDAVRGRPSEVIERFRVGSARQDFTEERVRSERLAAIAEAREAMADAIVMRGAELPSLYDVMRSGFVDDETDRRRSEQRLAQRRQEHETVVAERMAAGWRPRTHEDILRESVFADRLRDQQEAELEAQAAVEAKRSSRYDAWVSGIRHGSLGAHARSARSASVRALTPWA